MSITLTQLEQATARRVGPFAQYMTDRQVPTTASFTEALFPELRSNIELDLVTNLWLLRRGNVWNTPDPITLDVADRQRVVSTYEPATGRVLPERPWSTIPAPGEICEFHHLNPDQELRVAVQAGLRRCFLPDTLYAQPTALWGGIDLTAQYPWLTDTWQLRAVRYGWLQPYQRAPWDSHVQAGHLILTGTYGWYLPMAVWIDVWRPAWSRVNGEDSDTGPTNDDDVLDVNLDYAASAGHIEAWHLFPAKLEAAAAGGLQATQAQAATEFTRQALMNGPQRNVEIGFNNLFRVGLVGGSWVNGPRW